MPPKSSKASKVKAAPPSDASALPSARFIHPSVLKMIESAPASVELHLSAGIDCDMALESAAAATIQALPDDITAEQKARVLTAVDRVGLWSGEIKKHIDVVIYRKNPSGRAVGKLCVHTP